MSQQRNPAGRHFDFACGTGRITRLAEEIFAEVDALDISAAMVEVARAAGRHAQFYVGNILESPNLCPGPYASITTFRLLLNIDPPLRVPVLIQLHRRLQADGVLIFNVHGNRHSLRHPALLWNRWRHRYEPSGVERLLNDMSRSEVESCLEAAGFVVEHVYGIGILPQTVYRWPFSPLWRGIDRRLSGLSLLKPFSIDLLFVCRPKNLPAE
jgi:SAM-dependent methyltransferase